MIREIDGDELKTRLDSGSPTYLVDVRQPWEHEIAALPGSKLIPLPELHKPMPKSCRRMGRWWLSIAITASAAVPVRRSWSRWDIHGLYRWQAASTPGRDTSIPAWRDIEAISHAQSRTVI